jgi:hypothetical protein
MRNVCTICEDGFPLDEDSPGVMEGAHGMNVHGACAEPEEA